MPRSLLAGLVLAAFASATIRNSAEAQLGGLIKKKISDAVKKPDKPDEQKKPESNTNGPFNSSVLEITQPTFDATIRGLTTELKLQGEFLQVVAKYPTTEQYEACKTRTVMSPEGTKIMSGYQNMPQGISAEDAQKRMLAMGVQMDSLQKKECPLDPNVWNDYHRKQKLDSIHVQAAEAAGEAAATSSLPPDTHEILGRRFGVEQFTFTGTRVAFLTEYQYSVLLERIGQGCTITDRNPNGVKVPGSGNGIYWIFTGNEMSVLTPANCTKFLDLIKRVIYR